MPAQWTGELIGEMHTRGITAKRLAEAMGWNPKYLSGVLNGHYTPKRAEEKLRVALERLTASQEQSQDNAGKERKWKKD